VVTRVRLPIAFLSLHTRNRIGGRRVRPFISQRINMVFFVYTAARKTFRRATVFCLGATSFFELPPAHCQTFLMARRLGGGGKKMLRTVANLIPISPTVTWPSQRQIALCRRPGRG